LGAWAVALALLAAMVIFAGPRVRREWRNRATVRRIARQGASASDAALLYRRMLEAMEKRGFERPSFFTPVEFARHLPPGEIEPVAQFTAVYNAVRFGGDTAGAAELVKLLEPFERRSNGFRAATGP